MEWIIVVLLEMTTGDESPYYKRNYKRLEHNIFVCLSRFFSAELPVRRIFPIEALSPVKCAINFGLVADEAPMRLGNTVQFMR